jgi:hypothetical protein
MGGEGMGYSTAEIGDRIAADVAKVTREPRLRTEES